MIYSHLKLLTRMRIAAFRAWKLTVFKATNPIIKLATVNTTI